MFVKPNDTIVLILLGTSLVATLAAIIFCRQFRPSKFFPSAPTTTTATETNRSYPSASLSYEYTDEYTTSLAQLPADYDHPSSGYVQDPLSPHDDNGGARMARGPHGRGYSYVTSASSASSEFMLGALGVEEGNCDVASGSVSSGREQH